MGRVVAASRVARPRVASRVARDAPRGDVALELRRRVRANGRGGGDEGKHRVGARACVSRGVDARALDKDKPLYFFAKIGYVRRVFG